MEFSCNSELAEKKTYSAGLYSSEEKLPVLEIANKL